MLPDRQGTVDLKLGSQLWHEAYQPLKRWTHAIEEEYTGGKWLPCMHRGSPGQVWEVPDAEAVWVIKLENYGELKLRVLSVRREEVGLIVEQKP